LFAGHSDFSNKFINLSGHAYATLAEAKAAGAATINYGLFFNSLSDFLIVAFMVFMLIRQVDRLKRAKGICRSDKRLPIRLSAVAIKATRCPHCTSGLATAKVEFEGPAEVSIDEQARRRYLSFSPGKRTEPQFNGDDVVVEARSRYCRSTKLCGSPHLGSTM
jgi:hypothetical protein